ncbi:hypothetical protein [Nocardia wallacei]|uniref:hypothetical protein n=1 Tax=Nocardia wallacei TaxID=480035 RepID=UPI0024549D57|nr:hypothetical protein [Nocardia wallacei]
MLDAYQSLRGLISRRYRSVDLGVVESRPQVQSQRVVLAEELAQSGAGDDHELLRAAEHLLLMLEEHAPRAAESVGVTLDRVRADALEITDITSSWNGVGTTDMTVIGTLKIDGVRSGSQQPPHPPLGSDQHELVGGSEPSRLGRSLGEGDDSGTLNWFEVPVTIYLSDETAAGEVQNAVENLLGTTGAEVISRDDPIRGSWFRAMKAAVRRRADSPAVREAGLTAARSADAYLQMQVAENTAKLMENLGPVIESLADTKQAVIRVGAVLLVKANESMVVHQLTADQQIRLDHQPGLLRSPREILVLLEPTPVAAHDAADHWLDSGPNAHEEFPSEPMAVRWELPPTDRPGYE